LISSKSVLIFVTLSTAFALSLPSLLVPGALPTAEGTAARLTSMAQPAVGALGQVSQSSYDQAVLANNPTLFYPLTGTSSTVTQDTSGHANNGTFAGGVSTGVSGPLVGAPSTAVQLNGTSGYIYDGTTFADPQSTHLRCGSRQVLPTAASSSGLAAPRQGRVGATTVTST